MSDGFVYFIKPVGMTGPIKIGHSTSPQYRLRALMCLSPVPLEIIKTCRGGVASEGYLHEKFSHLRSHGEWFRADDELLRYIEDADADGALPQRRMSKLETYLSNKTITQTAFAEKIGVTQAALSRYMQGKRKVPLGVIAKVQTATKGAVTFKDWLASSEAPSKQTEGV